WPADAVNVVSCRANRGMNREPQFNALVKRGSVRDSTDLTVKARGEIAQASDLVLGHPTIRAHQLPAQLKQSAPSCVQHEPEYFSPVRLPRVGQGKWPHSHQLIVASLKDAVPPRRDQIGAHWMPSQL